MTTNRSGAQGQLETALLCSSVIMAANASGSSNLAVVGASPLRRRSVHFDSSPTEIVGGGGGGGGGQQDLTKAFPKRRVDADGIREEEDEPDEPDVEEEEDEEERPPSSSSSPSHPPTSSFDPKLALRRQSAPAASIALGAAITPPGTEPEDEVLSS